MLTTGKRSLHSYSGNPSSLLTEIQSKLHPSSQKKNHHKMSYTKKCKLKSLSHARTKGSRNRIVTGKRGRHMEKKLDFISSKDQSFVKALGKEQCDSSNRGNWKNSCHDDGNGKHKGRRCRRKKENIVQDEAFRLHKRTRYLLIKMKLEQNLLDAYSREGWKGQSREKLKPEKELERAERQILKCKLGIRDVIQQLDMLSREGCIDDSKMLPDGSVFHEHIFCAICKSCEAFQDNDIILCDGACNCAYHQKCLEPPLKKIPPGDQGWLCKFCVCKMEILESVNAHLGTGFSVDSSWKDIFKEAAVGTATGNNYLDPDQEWPSEDSEDIDYNPERSDEGHNRASTDLYMSDKAGSFSSSLYSPDQASSHSGFSLNYDKSEGLSQLKHRRKDRRNFISSVISDDFDDTDINEIQNYQRQRRAVDYKKLYDEMFGKELLINEQRSEDEDWGPYRMKRKGTQSNADTTTARNNEKDAALELVSLKGAKEKQDSLLQYRKTIFRIPPNALEKLRQVFAENELPSRAVKENLSEQLGIAVEKVSKWFKNARYAALRIRKEESTEFPSCNAIQNSHSTVRKRSSNSHTLSSSPVIHAKKDIRLLQKCLNPMSFPSKTQKNRAANRLHSVIVQASTQIKKRKTYAGKEPVMSKPLHVGESDADQLYFVELERLCNLEERLEKLKAALKECGDHSNASNETHSSGPPVIYVPVIVVKEKV